MKQNTPVTQRERQVPPGEVLVSKTDLRGVITYANSTFAEVSGYRIDELVGQSHNLVRHPDVPPQVFADLWASLKKGQPWRGILKNRARNGDHYWVESFVMPLMTDGKITGYQSVRRRAGREDIEAAEKHYGEIEAGNSVACPRGIRIDQLLSIRRGVALGIAYVTALLLIGALAGLGIMRQAETELKAMYESKVQAGDALARIKFLMADNRAQVMRGLLRDSAGAPAEAGERTLPRLAGAIAQNRSEIDRLWETFRRREMGGETAKLADGYWEARQRYVREGLEPAVRMLAAGNLRETRSLLSARVERLYESANARADELMSHLMRDAEAGYAREQARHDRARLAMLSGIALALAILGGSGFLFFRGIVTPLDKGIANLTRIAQGDLSGAVDIGGGGEIGRLSCALSMTQAQLLVMTEEIANGVTRVSSECGMLNSTVRRISDGIDEEHERIYQVADRLAELSQAMSRLSCQAEEIFHSAEAAVEMERKAGREFTELLMEVMIIADAVFLFREQLDALVANLEGMRASARAGDDAMPEIAAAVAEMRKIGASLAALGKKIEQDKPWEMALDSAKDRVEALGGSLAQMARELATETRIQSFASEDARREMGKVAMFLVEDREAMHALWHASSNLGGLAAALEKTAGEFKVG